MGDPAQSLFCGVELQLDAVNQQEIEEEEDEREEAARLEANLAEKMAGAFDDLDIESDEESDESVLCQLPVTGYGLGAEMRTPQMGGDQYLMTSTPYTNHNVQFQPPISTPYQEPTHDYDHYGDDLNKSDTEKVLAKKLGSVNFRADDLDILYNARGKEIDKLQKQLSDVREEYETELRSCRHQLALARSESHNNAGDLGQLQRVVSDVKRENKVLTEEIHSLNLKLKKFSEENETLKLDKESCDNIIQQLQIQLSQLQANDAVLKVRTQYDATIKSMLERHKQEVTSLRSELDKANTKLVLQEQESSNLNIKLRGAIQEKEEAVRSKVETVTELSAKLTESIRSNHSEEVIKLRAELDLERREREREVKERRRLEKEVDQLKVEVGAMEALQVRGHDESASQLGLIGADVSSDISTNQRVRDELHRSLISNRTKREEISRLEASIKNKDREMEVVQSKEHEYLRNIESLKNELHSVSINLSNKVNLRNTSNEDHDRKDIQELEKQNAELKKHISEIVEGNDIDKQEAIDELREEYEQHVQEAVQETKTLMEAETKKLRIEIDVYDKTLLELRDKLSGVEVENSKLLTEVQDLKSRLSDPRQSDNVPSQKEVEDKIRAYLEKEYDAKMEKSKNDLIDRWKVEARLQAEEAVASARLEWMKKLPEIQKNGAMRESIGELENIKQMLLKQKESKSDLEKRLKDRDLEFVKMTENLQMMQRKVEISKKEGMKEVEETLGKELKESLRQQQEKWETIVKNTRQEAEVSRNQLIIHWERQVELLEQKLRLRDKEKMELSSRERQASVIIEQMKQTLNEKELMIERIKRDKPEGNDGQRRDREMKLLQDELVRRNSDVQRQREEMESLRRKWEIEMEDILSSHHKEKQELDEFKKKYILLKAKVKKYQEHSEAKEEHYKSEYSRLENEFRNTLETLRLRVESAYCSKERMVDTELGVMKEELSREMRQIIRTGNPHSHHHKPHVDIVNEKPVKLVNST